MAKTVTFAKNVHDTVRNNDYKMVSTPLLMALTNKVIHQPFSKITCPHCEKKYIKIHIVPWENEEPKVDIHVFCEPCGFKCTITKDSSVVEK